MSKQFTKEENYLIDTLMSFVAMLEPLSANVDFQVACFLSVLEEVIS